MSQYKSGKNHEQIIGIAHSGTIHYNNALISSRWKPDNGREERCKKSDQLYRNYAVFSKGIDKAT